MSSKPPHIKLIILKHSQLWAPQLYFFMVIEAYSTLQTISAMFYTAQEMYISKKNTAVVILASACSPSRVGTAGEKKWMEDQTQPEPSQISVFRRYFHMVCFLPSHSGLQERVFLKINF